MSSLFVPTLLFYYGLFLMCCGVMSVVLMGWKAKTALVSGGTAGVIAITIGHFSSKGSGVAVIAGVVVCLGLFIVFCWRSTKTLFKVFELIPITDRHEDLKSKGIAFLIISLMAAVSIVTLLLQLVALTTG